MHVVLVGSSLFCCNLLRIPVQCGFVRPAGCARYRRQGGPAVQPHADAGGAVRRDVFGRGDDAQGKRHAGVEKARADAVGLRRAASEDVSDGWLDGMVLCAGGAAGEADSGEADRGFAVSAAVSAGKDEAGEGIRGAGDCDAMPSRRIRGTLCCAAFPRECRSGCRRRCWRLRRAG